MFANNCYDLTKLIDEKFPSYPGDPKFHIETIHSIGKNHSFALEYIHIGNHTGTHIDFPAHIIPDGKNSLDFPIRHLMGDGFIVVNRGVDDLIKFLGNLELKNKIIFFKNMEYLDNKLANFLVEKKVKIIGIDGLSVDLVDDIELPIHNILLKHDILIVENLCLQEVNERECYVLIAPLKLSSDGLPTRVLIW